MSRLIASSALALLLAACGPSGPRLEPPPGWQQVARPGDVVATELAFARAAQEDGQWTAFRAYAADDAVMFTPQPVNAQEWLKGRADPPQAIAWQPHQLWSSCDGSLAVTKGAWQLPDGSVGYFTTIWRRQEDGTYRWVLDQGDNLDQPLVEPEFVQAESGDCDDLPGASMLEGLSPEDAASAAHVGTGEARDHTLAYRYFVKPDGARELSVFLLRGGAMQEVLRSEVHE